MLFLLGFILFVHHAWSTENQSYKFERINVNEGLSHRFITDIQQDSQGFMWFGTRDGLNRYDGKTFKVYKHKQGDSVSLSSNIVLCMIEDSNQNLWMGLEENGIARYNRGFDNFTNFKQFSWNYSIVNLDTVNKLFEDSKRNLWLGSQEGLFRLQLDSFTFDYFMPNETPTP